MLTRIRIRNFRVFRDFSLDLRRGPNILVGDNDAGKSTILEAINIVLTGRLRRNSFLSELSPHHFNQSAVASYSAALASGTRVRPPEITIDAYLEDSADLAELSGTNNLATERSPGIQMRALFNRDYLEEYRRFVADAAANEDPIELVPVEYYRTEWTSFSGNPITGRGVPASVSMIDSAAIRLFSGADFYLQQIIDSHLSPKERVEISHAYRSLREKFSKDNAIAAINKRLRLDDSNPIADRVLSLSIDVSQRTAWETSLVPHLDALPFHFNGKGAQSQLKVLLALARDADDSHVVLIEEPENHLSPASLNGLVREIQTRCADKQVVIATHSSYVLNKLGIDNLVMLGSGDPTRLTDLPTDTLTYFKRLSGYDTLRLVLTRRAILVEGPSDELIIQRAYRDEHGMLPLEDGVDVINVRGLSFRRFLDIARPLHKSVVVVTDNDGKPQAEVVARYRDYTEDRPIKICAGSDDGGRTLEPQVVNANSLELLNEIFDTEISTADEMIERMRNAKTEWALKVFESRTTIVMPDYIRDAVRR